MAKHLKAAALALGVSAFPLLFATVAHADTPVVGPVSVYGTIDVGVAYQSSGVGVNGATGVEYQAWTTTRNFGGSQTMVSENALANAPSHISWKNCAGDFPSASRNSENAAAANANASTGPATVSRLRRSG